MDTAIKDLLEYLKKQRDFNQGWIALHIRDGHPDAARQRKSCVERHDGWIEALQRTDLAAQSDASAIRVLPDTVYPPNLYEVACDCVEKASALEEGGLSTVDTVRSVLATVEVYQRPYVRYEHNPAPDDERKRVALGKAIQRADKLSKNFDELRYAKPNAHTGQIYADCANGLNALRTYLNEAALQSPPLAKLDIHIVLDALATAAKGEPLDPDICLTIEDIAKQYGHKDFGKDEIQALYDCPVKAEKPDPLAGTPDGLVG